MGFSRQEDQSGLPFPSPLKLQASPYTGINLAREMLFSLLDEWACDSSRILVISGHSNCVPHVSFLLEDTMIVVLVGEVYNIVRHT